jgi:hypothetical protein
MTQADRTAVRMAVATIPMTFFMAVSPFVEHRGNLSYAISTANV